MDAVEEGVESSSTSSGSVTNTDGSTEGNESGTDDFGLAGALLFSALVMGVLWILWQIYSALSGLLATLYRSAGISVQPSNEVALPIVTVFGLFCILLGVVLFVGGLMEAWSSIMYSSRASSKMESAMWDSYSSTLDAEAGMAKIVFAKPRSAGEIGLTLQLPSGRTEETTIEAPVVEDKADWTPENETALLGEYLGVRPPTPVHDFAEVEKLVPVRVEENEEDWKEDEFVVDFEEIDARLDEDAFEFETVGFDEHEAWDSS